MHPYNIREEKSPQQPSESKAIVPSEESEGYRELSQLAFLAECYGHRPCNRKWQTFLQRDYSEPLHFTNAASMSLGISILNTAKPHGATQEHERYGYY